MKYYEFKLANDERWYLITDKTLQDIKQYIIDNKWIKLHSCGWKSTTNGYTFLPKESDIQTCNIVYVNEDEEYQKIIDEEKQSKEERLEIIEKIESYEFNLRMKWWYFRKIWYLNEELEHPLLTFNKEFLTVILKQCKKYKCKRRKTSYGTKTSINNEYR